MYPTSQKKILRKSKKYQHLPQINCVSTNERASKDFAKQIKLPKIHNFVLSTKSYKEKQFLKSEPTIFFIFLCLF